MSSGNLEPGGSFKVTGSIATFASNIVAPSLLSGEVQSAMLDLARKVIPAEGLSVLISTIKDLVPSP